MINVGFVSAISSGGYGCFFIQTRIKVVQTSYDLGCMPVWLVVQCIR